MATPTIETRPHLANFAAEGISKSIPQKELTSGFITLIWDVNDPVVPLKCKFWLAAWCKWCLTHNIPVLCSYKITRFMSKQDEQHSLRSHAEAVGTPVFTPGERLRFRLGVRIFWVQWLGDCLPVALQMGRSKKTDGQGSTVAPSPHFSTSALGRTKALRRKRKRKRKKKRRRALADSCSII